MSLIFKGIYLGGGGGGSANLTTLDVTPMTNYQSISPEEGYDGFSLVNVSAVNSSIDPNITASNIVNGVNILGVTGIAEASAPKEVARYVVYDNGGAGVSNKNITGHFDDITFVNSTTFEGAFSNTGVQGDISFPNCNRFFIRSFNHGFSSTSITSFSAPLAETSQAGVFNGCFQNCRSLTSVNLGSLKANQSDSDAFSMAFRGCNHLVDVNFNSMLGTFGNNAFYYAFEGCSNLPTLSFPMFNRIASGGGAFQSACGNCSNLTSFSMSNLTQITGENCFYRTFENCYNLTNVNFGHLGWIYSSNIFYQTFMRANNFSDNRVFASLTTISLSTSPQRYGAFSNTFIYCNNLTDIIFEGLSTIYGANAFNMAFNGSAIKNIYFNSFVEYNNTSVFANMLRGTTDVTVHFSKSMEPIMNTWTDVTSGFYGTNATVLFDLQSVSNDKTDIWNYFSNTQSSGVLGGNFYAVSASSESADAWKAMTTDSAIGWHSAPAEAPHYFEIYSPAGMAPYMISTVTRNSVDMATNTPVFINICVSNDGTNWTETRSEKEWYNASTYRRGYCNPITPGFHKYYRLYFNSYNNDPSYLTTINNIEIQGVFRYNEE